MPVSFLSLHLSFYHTPAALSLTSSLQTSYSPAWVFRLWSLVLSSCQTLVLLSGHHQLSKTSYFTSVADHQLKLQRGRLYCRPLSDIQKCGCVFMSVHPLDYLPVLILPCLTSGSAQYALSASRLPSSTTLALPPSSPTDLFHSSVATNHCLSEVASLVSALPPGCMSQLSAFRFLSCSTLTLQAPQLENDQQSNNTNVKRLTKFPEIKILTSTHECNVCLK